MFDNRVLNIDMLLITWSQYSVVSWNTGILKLKTSLSVEHIRQTHMIIATTALESQVDVAIP